MIHALVVDCESSIYDRLCDTISAGLQKGGTNHDIIQKNHKKLTDVLNSGLEDIEIVVFSGSSTYLPNSPGIKNAVDLMQMTLQKDKYGFGSCFGAQLLAYVLDPKYHYDKKTPENGRLVKQGSWDEDVEIQIIHQDPIFEGVANPFITRQYHNYSLLLPEGQDKIGTGKILAKSKDGAEIIRANKIVGTIFHPESLYASEDALRIIENYFSNKNLKL